MTNYRLLGCAFGQKLIASVYSIYRDNFKCCWSDISGADETLIFTAYITYTLVSLF